MNRPSNMPRRLKDYYSSFRRISELYRMLSRSAPNEREQKMLDEFSHECHHTAEEFAGAYRAMTGYRLDEPVPPVKESGSYRSVIRGRIPAEIGLSRQLRTDYLSVNDNYRLKRTFFTACHEALERSALLTEMLIA